MVISSCLKSMIVLQIGIGISAWSQVGQIARELRAEAELWLFGLVSRLRGSADSSAFHCLIDGSFFYIKMFSGCDHLYKEFNGVGMIQSFLGGVLIGPHESVCMNSGE